MKFQNTETWGFQHALRGMRNPKNSWNKSDSYICDKKHCAHCDIRDKDQCSQPDEYHIRYSIGPNDMKLAKALIQGGPEHRKFLRQIFVSVDITAPLYWWKQFDTYKIGTVANSTSTMHKLTSKPITLDCFEIDDFNQDLEYYATNTTGMLSDLIIEQLEFLRQKYLETKDKRYWKQLVRWLPQGWLQTRTWTANYEVIRTIVHQRQMHKLNQWSGLDDPSKNNFIKWAKTLPYADEFIFN